MLELSAVLSSDSITRNFTRFTAGGIFRGLADLWATGIPSLISHDSHRLAGWTVPTALSFQPGLTRLHGITQIPETKQEQSRLETAYQMHLGRRVESETAPHIDKLREQLKEHLDGSESPQDCGATALVAPGLARRVAPEVFEAADKGGLVLVKDLQQVQSGVYRHGDLVLFAHPYLRRSLSRWNNLNSPLATELALLAKEPGANVRILLDPDAVGLAESARMPIELEYWYGPKFSDDLSSIPTGVTRHEANDQERYFHGISRTEFWWQSRDGQHIFEAEELRDIPTLGSGAGRYGCRYTHSIIDEATNRIVHLDGAIRDYSEEEMLSRLDCSINEAGRHTTYTKVWRVDGDIPLATWKTLVHHHFRDNSLIGEYLDEAAKPRLPGDERSAPVGSGPDQPNHRRRRPSDVLPPPMGAGNSVRMLLSFHHAPEEPLAASRVLHPLEDLVNDDERVTVFEADVLELEKLLRRNGHELLLPAGAARLAFEDRYHTFPLIQHDSFSAVEPTLDAIEQLLSAWNGVAADRVLAVSIGVVEGEREIRLAVVGHVADIPKQMERIRSFFECADDDARVDWVDKTAEAMVPNGCEPGVPPTPRDDIVDQLSTPTATFRISRTIIDPNDLQIRWEEDVPQYQLRLGVDEGEMLSALKEGRMHVAWAWLIRKSLCTKCGDEYLTCPCSKYIDEGAGQKCTDANIAYAFWTDRPA